MGKHTKKPVSIRFDEAEIELLKELAESHGGQSAAIVAGLHALKAGSAKPTPAEALAVLAAEFGLDPPRKRKKR